MHGRKSVFTCGITNMGCCDVSSVSRRRGWLVMELSRKPSVRRLLIGLMTAHFLFIITMKHHGSVGWGTGRFFLPLYPILAFGLSAFSNLAVWKEHAARALSFATMIYSAVFALAGVRYGVQGVMEPGVPTLKFRFLLDYSAFLQGLIWVAIIAGVIVELLYSTFRSNAEGSEKRIAPIATNNLTWLKSSDGEKWTETARKKLDVEDNRNQPFAVVEMKSKRGGRSRQLASAGFASPC
jgi:hypothetical protein